MSTPDSALRIAPGVAVAITHPPASTRPLITIGGQVVGPTTGQLAEFSSMPTLTPEQVAIERIAVAERLRATARLRLREGRAALAGLSGQTQAGLLIAALALLAVATVGIVWARIARRDRG